MNSAWNYAQVSLKMGELFTLCINKDLSILVAFCSRPFFSFQVRHNHKPTVALIIIIKWLEALFLQAEW